MNGSTKLEKIKSLIRTIPNWPHEGIMFRDITTLLLEPEGLRMSVDLLAERYKDASLDVICGIESRGFIFGAVLADRLGLGFVPIRKKGKLPGETISQEYDLEYGKDIIEIHTDAIKSGSKVLIVDDLLATGGTALGASKLVKQVGGVIHEACFIVNLPDLNGDKKLKENNISNFSLIEFEGE